MGIKLFKRTLATLGLLLPLSCLWATPGAVDRYNCHSTPGLDDYHCHGTDDETEQNHFLIGIASPHDLWSYDDGPSNTFSGAAVGIEYGDRFFAGYGQYSYQVHVTGNDDYLISGFDVGLKAGPEITRFGVHPYVTVGYFTYRYTLPSEFYVSFSGLQYGGGLIWNSPGFSADARLLYRNPQEIQDIWTGWGVSGPTSHLSGQVGIYLRY